MPDVSAFPRAAWMRSVREAMRTITDFDLGYGDPRGMDALRVALVDYFGRVRGVHASAANLVITSGYSQGLGVVCHALAARGARRIAIEHPSNLLQRELATRAGLEPVPVPVDAHGIVVDALPAADAVVVTPAHQHPTGVLLSPERRAALIAWLREHDATVIEDDYDAEFRYDRAAVGAVQGLDPERVIYAGSVSKTLAPALRLGWLVVPSPLVARVAAEKVLADRGTARIDQLAYADFLRRGELDRHLRRMRIRYRARRDALVEAVSTHFPRAEILGIAAGLHATVRLDMDEDTLRAAAAGRRIAFETMRDYEAADGTLLLGYALMPEPTIRAGIAELSRLPGIRRR
jgi:GntR family transcriptional regulator/MocR family aminotransferase